MLEQYETILIPEEVCEILRIGQNEVYKMLKNKEICGYKVGKTWRIPKENVIHYIKSKRRSSEEGIVPTLHFLKFRMLSINHIIFNVFHFVRLDHYSMARKAIG